jgi:hypothetical protein
MSFHARIPEKSSMDYRIKPKSQVDDQDLQKAKLRAKQKHAKDKTLEKYMLNKRKGHSTSSRVVPRAVSISIEGRQLHSYV